MITPAHGYRDMVLEDITPKESLFLVGVILFCFLVGALCMAGAW